MISLPEQLAEAATYIRLVGGNFTPEAGIILGTGLGGLVGELEIVCSIPYASIPHFPIATVESHSGQLVLGMLHGKKVICMHGRFHFYEGYSMKQVTFPVRVMHRLGADTLFVSNAAGALNPDFRVGDLMLIADHISLFLPENPLTGIHFPEFGDRFPDMCDPYDLSLLQEAETIAAENKIKLRKGVYVSAPGPQLETRAEYRLLRLAGADAVGMSTVPEIIVARQLDMRCLGLSVITDMGIPETLKKASLASILAAAEAAEPELKILLKELVHRLPGTGQA